VMASKLFDSIRSAGMLGVGLGAAGGTQKPAVAKKKLGVGSVLPKMGSGMYLRIKPEMLMPKVKKFGRK